MVLVVLGFVLLLLGVAEVGDRTALAGAAAGIGVLAGVLLLLGALRARPRGLPEEPEPWAGASREDPAAASPPESIAATGRTTAGDEDAGSPAAPAPAPDEAASNDEAADEQSVAHAYAKALSGVCGPARQRLLLERYGTLAALRHATVGELAAIPGIDRARAEGIHARLHAEADPSHDGAEDAAAPLARPPNEDTEERP